MKASNLEMSCLLDGVRQLNVPIYQRRYSWGEKECHQFWSDIIKVGESERPEHFVGMIVYKDEGVQGLGEVKKFTLIDGQQRITTLALLIAALIEHIRQNPSKRDPDQLKKNYLVNDGKPEYYKLSLTEDDRDTFECIMDGKEPPSDPSKAVVESFKYFKKWIEKTEDLEVVWSGISKLKIVDVILAKDDEPQRIFESINSTGLKLSQADLIRNFVLMGMDPEMQNKIYKEYWRPMEAGFGKDARHHFDRFVRDYLTIKTVNIPRENEIYEEFKNYLEKKKMVEVIADLHYYSKIYASLVFEQDLPDEVLGPVRDINTLQTNVAYPFLMRVCSDLYNGTTDVAGAAAVLKMVADYVFRRWICSMPSNALNSVFASLARMDVSKDVYVEKINAAIINKTGDGEFPSDDDFKMRFVTKKAARKKRFLNYMLEKLENHGQRVKIVISREITVEHIMPRSLTPEWEKDLGSDHQRVYETYLDTIGNITLSAYNPGLGNKPFLEKRDMDPGGYANSKINLNGYLAKLDHWDEEAIVARADHLAGRAVRIWAYPELDPATRAKYNKDEVDDDPEESDASSNWDEAMQKANVEIREIIESATAVLKDNFECAVEEKGMWRYFCLERPISTKTLFVALRCGVGSARIAFRANPNSFNEEPNVSSTKRWFFPPGTERRAPLHELSQGQLLHFANHAFAATESHLNAQ